MADLSKIIIPDGTEYDIKDATARSDIASKQDTLVSGTNIKTVNGNSLLGSGDITIAGGGSQNTWYGTCPTAAATQAKVVTTTDGNFTLAEGNMVRVKFTNAQTYNGGITLNVDGTGAKSVMRQGTTATVRYFFLAGEVVDFVYDGTNFLAVNEGIATTTYYGVTKLSSSTSSTSTGMAATASAVKAAYDLANGKSTVSVSQTLTSGTAIGSVTVDGTATTLYAPSGSTDEALTDAEIEEAVDDAFPSYNLTTTSNLGFYDSYDPAEYAVGNQITTASEGSVVYAVELLTPMQTLYVERLDTGASISTSLAGYVMSGASVYSFVMPPSDINADIIGGGQLNG